MPALSWSARGGGLHSVFDENVKCNFDRQRLKDSAALETKYIRLMMVATYGKPLDDATQGKVIVRKLPNVGESHIPLLKLTSHTKKRSACDQTAHSGVLWASLLMLQKAENRQTALLYQERESMELTPVRQLLNAPPGLLPQGRVVSMLDLLQQLRILETKLCASEAAKVCTAPPAPPAPYPLAFF